MMPDAFLDGIVAATRVPVWQAQLASASGLAIFVAERAARLVGFVTCGAAEDATLPSSCGQLFAIYVEPEVFGDGVGYALAAAAANELRARGYARAILWVLEQNARARRFYERQGWRADGTTHIDTRPDHVRHELRYAIDL
jgi:ribosomal protein S18 acetylase RimI-like enzyme